MVTLGVTYKCVGWARTIFLYVYIGLARTIYIRCIHGIFGREITKYTVIYGVCIRSWPTLRIYGVHTVFLAGKSPNKRSYTVYIRFWPTL